MTTIVCLGYWPTAPFWPSASDDNNPFGPTSADPEHNSILAVHDAFSDSFRGLLPKVLTGKALVSPAG
jgi:hypothetical protein